VRLLIVGPPGVGKGTQSRLLSDALGVPAISTGDLFREHVRVRSPLGVQVERILSAGDYVPDALTNELVRERVVEPDAAAGFILDGYPRTVDQVAELDRMLVPAGIGAVVQLHADDAQLLDRVRERQVQQRRDDDAADVMRHRIEIYRERTAPLVDVYRERGILVPVDGLGAIPDVHAAILGALARHPSSTRPMEAKHHDDPPALRP
jgi:adenylate kinase